MEQTIHNATTASLRVSSARLLPTVITEALGRKPTRSGERGSLMSPRNPDSQKREVSFWLLESELPESAELEDHVASLLSIVEERSTQLQQIRGLCDIDICCAFFSKQSQGGFFFSVDLMRRVVAIEADLVFDIYGNSEA
jgi:Domain of unknown function (DUF4279)